ncbi:MAG: hypothetical protein WCZ89_09655 [Phycisphaerae bacterium]
MDWRFFAAAVFLSSGPMHNFTKLIFFTIFFSIGAAALTTAVLYQDLLRYYQYNYLLRQAEQSLINLKSINEEYDELLNNLQADSRMLDRAAMAVLGLKPDDPNSVYPKASPEQVAAAKKALSQASEDTFDQPQIPLWMERIGEPRKRLSLFLTGCALIILAFVGFGTFKKIDEKTANRSPAEAG